MDPNLDFYRSILHLPPWERRERMQHLSKSECDRVRTTVEREDDARMLEEAIAGRDLVEVALTDPSEIIGDMQLKQTLLGQTIYSADENTMVERITEGKAQSSSELIGYIEGFDKSVTRLCLDAWKLVYCDICYIDMGGVTLHETYETRLRDEQLQMPVARARELVRDSHLKKARRNAKWMIPALERLATQTEPAEPNRELDELFKEVLERSPIPNVLEKLFEQHGTRESMERIWKSQEPEERLERIWKEVSPAPPTWIQKIITTQEQWGFVYYLSKEVDKEYGRNWKSTWIRINNTSPPSRVSWQSIHCQGRTHRSDLERLSTENWPIFQHDEELAEENYLRKHFKQYIEKNQSKTQEDEKMKKKMKKQKYRILNEYTDVLSPGLQRNTFIVIPIELVDGNRKVQEGDILDPDWVWAYDAGWDSTQAETIMNGEKYQGRVKVAKDSLKSWFYGACWEGVSLRDMWLKAQRHPDKMWICYTKDLEEWSHEPYT
ncbi:hypothetical protein LB507_010230, partial [Fusarium sp. FIESC RH6]